MPGNIFATHTLLYFYSNRCVFRSDSSSGSALSLDNIQEGPSPFGTPPMNSIRPVMIPTQFNHSMRPCHESSSLGRSTLLGVLSLNNFFYSIGSADSVRLYEIYGERSSNSEGSLEPDSMEVERIREDLADAMIDQEGVSLTNQQCKFISICNVV